MNTYRVEYVMGPAVKTYSILEALDADRAKQKIEESIEGAKVAVVWLRAWDRGAKAVTNSQEEIAATLVARGWGYRLPLPAHRCWQTIQLKASTRGTGFIYVKRDGEIRSGYTMRVSRRVSDTLRRQMLGT